MYAFEMFLDTVTDKYVRECWKAIASAGISSFMCDIEGIRPHITLAVCDHVEVATVGLTSCSNQNQIDVKFDILAGFPTSGTLFLSPTITEEHIRFHQKFYKVIHSSSAEYNGHYMPGHWNPHCTLATRLNRAELAQAYDLVVQNFEPLRSRIVEIGLVKLIYEGGICVKNVHLETVKLQA